MVRAHTGALALTAVLAACGGDPVATIDAGMPGNIDGGDDDEDASSPSAGLILELVGRPDRLPEEVEDGRLDSARIELEDVILMGDGGLDERTTESSHELAFDGEDEPIRFSNAPPSRYSRFLATVDGYELRGCVEEEEIDPEDCVPFVIVDPNANLDVEVEFEVVELEPGKLRTIVMEIRLDGVVDEMEWEQASYEDDTLVVDPDHPDGLDAARYELEQAFRYSGS